MLLVKSTLRTEIGDIITIVGYLFVLSPMNILKSRLIGPDCQCLIDFMPLCKRLSLESVKDGEKYEMLLQRHFSTLLDVQPHHITNTLLDNHIITYVVFDSYTLAINDSEYISVVYLRCRPIRNVHGIAGWQYS